MDAREPLRPDSRQEGKHHLMLGWLGALGKGVGPPRAGRPLGPFCLFGVRG